MVFLVETPQRTQLLKTVRSAFEDLGWKVQSRHTDQHDFRVDINRLNFLIKCFDENPIKFFSPTEIIGAIENYARDCRNLRGQQLVVVFDRNWLGVPFASLKERSIFAITLEDISQLTVLADISNGVPEGLNIDQTFLVCRCVEYAGFVARKYRQAGEVSLAITWARQAIEHTQGYSNAYPLLFSLLVEAKNFEAAAELGEKMVGYRPDDAQVIRSMAKLARLRGEIQEAERWTQRLGEERTITRSLDDILAKQRLPRSNSSAGPDPELEPEAERARKRMKFSRILRTFVPPSQR